MRAGTRSRHPAHLPRVPSRPDKHPYTSTDSSPKVTGRRKSTTDQAVQGRARGQRAPKSKDAAVASEEEAEPEGGAEAEEESAKESSDPFDSMVSSAGPPAVEKPEVADAADTGGTDSSGARSDNKDADTEVNKSYDARRRAALVGMNASTFVRSRAVSRTVVSLP